MDGGGRPPAPRAKNGDLKIDRIARGRYAISAYVEKVDFLMLIPATYLQMEKKG